MIKRKNSTSKPVNTTMLASKSDDPTELLTDKFMSNSSLAPVANSRASAAAASAPAAVVKKFVDLLLQPEPQTPEQYQHQKTQLMEIVNEGKSSLTMVFDESFLEQQGIEPSNRDIALALYLRLLVSCTKDTNTYELVCQLFLASRKWTFCVTGHLHRIKLLLSDQGERHHLHPSCLLASFVDVAKMHISKENRYVPVVLQGFLDTFVLIDWKDSNVPDDFIELVVVAMDILRIYDVQNAQNTIFPLAYRAIESFSDAEALHKHVLGFLIREPGVLQATTFAQMLTAITQFEKKFSGYELNHSMVNQFFSAVWNNASLSEKERQWLMAKMNNHFFVYRPRRTISADLLAVVARFSLVKALEYRSKCLLEQQDKICWDGRVLCEILLHASQLPPTATKRKEQIVSLVRELISRWKQSGKTVLLWESEAQRTEHQTSLRESIVKMLEEQQQQQLVNDWNQLVDEQKEVAISSAGHSKVYMSVRMPAAKAPFLVTLPALQVVHPKKN